MYAAVILAMERQNSFFEDKRAADGLSRSKKDKKKKDDEQVAPLSVLRFALQDELEDDPPEL